MVVPATALLERFRIDDAVGAIPVHGACGAWGTLAVGIFHEESGLLYEGGLGQLGVQALGVTVVLALVLGGSFVIFKAIDRAGFASQP